MPRSVLYIDPDEQDRDRFAEVVGRADDITASIAPDVETALAFFDDGTFDLVISEIDLEEGEVTELFSRARGTDRPVPCIVFTHSDIDELLEEDLLGHISAFVSKDREDPFQQLVDEVVDSLRPRSEIEYPVPDDEDERVTVAEEMDLARLRREESFDRLTELAAAFFDVKYAFVGIIQEETEQFISFAGEAVEEVARECSICTFGILDDDVTVVEDSQQDERFKYIDAIRELDVVFYAGSPIISEDGYRIGMFCITDDERRDFSQEDRSYLKLFAEEAEELIRLYEGDEDGHR